jgi:hypothetical protein
MEGPIGNITEEKVKMALSGIKTIGHHVKLG